MTQSISRFEAAIGCRVPQPRRSREDFIFNGDPRSETKYKFDIVSIKLLRVSVEELLAFGFCFKLI
jgi:hypothetical protein